MNKISNTMRHNMAANLPHALETALESYKEFSVLGLGIDKEEADKDKRTKDFKEYHTALKVALSHVQLLLKIAADLKDIFDEEREIQAALDMQHMIEKAHLQIADQTIIEGDFIIIEE